MEFVLWYRDIANMADKACVPKEKNPAVDQAYDRMMARIAGEHIKEKLAEYESELTRLRTALAAAEAKETDEFKQWYAKLLEIDTLKRALAPETQQVAEKQKLFEFACGDWAEDDTAIKAICAQHGIRDEDMPDMFKSTVICVEELSLKLMEATEARRVAEDLLREWQEDQAIDYGVNAPGCVCLYCRTKSVLDAARDTKPSNETTTTTK